MTYWVKTIKICFTLVRKIKWTSFFFQIHKPQSSLLEHPSASRKVISTAELVFT